ncbi:MAG: lipase family protein [Planctomycetaceae bacterium]|nr:lipase family protein [Planctomycetaceae bacterium]
MADFTLGHHYLKTALSLAHASYASYKNNPADYPGFQRFGFDTVVPFASDAGKDKEATRGYLAAREDAIVLAFRGTDEVEDWIINLNFLQVKDNGAMVHQGFALALASIWDRVDETLRDMMRQKSRKIWVTGHSLGGALATLATRRLANMNLGPVETFTFGQPRVGNAVMKTQIASPFYRFAYHSDPVPFAPFSIPKTVEYTHAGTLKQIDASGTIHEDETNFMTHLTSAIQSVKRIAGDFIGNDIKTFVVKRLKDHFMPNYVQRIESAIPR